MNAAVRAVVRASVWHRHEVIGIRGGYNGIFARAFEPLDRRSVSNILQQGGTFLETGRCARFLEPDGPAEAAAILRDKGLDALVVIGGNGSYKGALALHQSGFPAVVGVPGSIDNDVGGTDLSIGFDTAVNTAVDAIDRIRDTAFSLERVFFVEVMGRDTGHIAAAVGLASGAEAVIVPEEPTDIDLLTTIIDRGFEAGKRAAIFVVAEGDDAGGAARIRDRIDAATQHPLDDRVVILGYIQRGGSPTARDRILASRLGVAAVDALQSGQTAVAVGERCSEVALTPLETAVQEQPPLDLQILRLAEILSGVRTSR
ncbi:MAG: 6-phosphofructokinase [Candidatus Dadabacteria bacterium]|nr:MAG: 6-phosphofructokinase [Candidatus Dadabacteria bacterium]